MEYVIVTSIFDIKKRTQNPYKRSAVQYIELFKYICSLNVRVILFTEEHLVGLIPKSDHLTVVVKALEDLDSYKEMAESGVDTLRIPNNVTHLNIYYTAVVNSKISLMLEAQRLIKD